MSWFRVRSFNFCLRLAVRRSLSRWVVGAYRRGRTASTVTTPIRRAVDVSALNARIAARVEREKKNGTYDYVAPIKGAAVKRNGGLRGSTATRWRR